MRHWLRALDPEDPTQNADGTRSTPDEVLKWARAGREVHWTLARRFHMAPGDRIWFYFKLPYGRVAAMAEVMDEPYEAGGGAMPWRVPALLNLTATRALNRNPVLLADLSNQRPQGVIGVRDVDLVTFHRHAGL